MAKKKNVEKISDYRSFGRTVGTAFCILAGLFYWRDHPLAFQVTVVLGALLLAGGFLAPSALRLPYRGWMKFARAAAWFNTRLILTLVFYLLITPIALLLRLFGKSTLKLRWDKQATSYWIRREKVPFDPQRYEKHF